MGVHRNFSRGGNVDILFIIFKLLTISIPSKIILHWAKICFSEHAYFRAEWVEFSMNYKFCELYNKYTILSKYEQNTHCIQIASCLRAFPLLWNVASAREWDFTAQQFTTTENLLELEHHAGFAKFTRWIMKTRHSRYSFALSIHSDVRTKP